MPTGDGWTLGVEEEYQIIDPYTRELRPRAQRVLPRTETEPGQEIQHEFYLSQIESASQICPTLSDVRNELVRLRRSIIEAAAKDGNVIGASGTHPFSHWDRQHVTPKERYQSLIDDYQHLGRELIIFGFHVHVGVQDLSARVQVLNRARLWLTPLLALAANSPFWLGTDTGYASYRSEVWIRWPTAGPPSVFASREEYNATVQALIATGAIQDASKIYWDIRIPDRHPTLEFRVTDVCMTVDEAVMIAGLVRALTRACYTQYECDEPLQAVRPEVLRAAHWRAARYGLDDELVDVVNSRLIPAASLVESMLEFVRPALEDAGDWQDVSMLVHDTLKRGNGARRQRAAFERAGRMEDVVDLIVSETAKGV